jgi:hypothetical protein
VDIERRRREAAVAELAKAALAHLAVHEGCPRIGRATDPWRWWRHGQQEFALLRHGAWDMPAEVSIIGWLDKFPEMVAVREAFAADPLLGPRVDTMIGTEFGRQAKHFNWLLVEHVIQPMVLATGTYDFDQELFHSVYDAFERGSALRRSTWSSSCRSTPSTAPSRR